MASDPAALYADHAINPVGDCRKGSIAPHISRSTSLAIYEPSNESKPATPILQEESLA